MIEDIFIAEPTCRPQQWQAVHSGLFYPGEVVVAERWDRQWGELRGGERFFRVVFLTDPPHGDAVTVSDVRTTVCLPRGRATSCRVREIDRGLRSIGEARSVYFAGRGTGAGEASSFLGEEVATAEVGVGDPLRAQNHRLSAYAIRHVLEQR